MNALIAILTLMITENVETNIDEFLMIADATIQKTYTRNMTEEELDLLTRAFKGELEAE